MQAKGRSWKKNYFPNDLRVVKGMVGFTSREMCKIEKTIFLNLETNLIPDL